MSDLVPFLMQAPLSVTDVREQARIMEDRLHQIVMSQLDLQNFSNPQRAAIVEVEKLKLLLKVEVVPLWVKMSIAEKLDRVWTEHPENYTSKKKFIEEKTGISYSEYLDLLNIKRKIIPYFEQAGIDPLQFYSTYKPSNIREIVPALRAVITGEASESPMLNETIERLLSEKKEIDPAIDDASARRLVIDDILEQAEGTNASLRSFLRPNDTPAVEMIVAKRNGSYIVLAELDPDQLLMLKRLNGKNQHIEFIHVEASDLPNIPIVKSLP